MHQRRGQSAAHRRPHCEVPGTEAACSGTHRASFDAVVLSAWRPTKSLPSSFAWNAGLTAALLTSWAIATATDGVLAITFDFVLETCMRKATSKKYTTKLINITIMWMSSAGLLLTACVKSVGQDTGVAL